MPSLEVLAVLADEVGEAAAVMAAALADLGVANGPEQTNEAVERYADQVQRIGVAGGVLNLAGLQRLCEHIGTNVAELPAAAAEPERLALFTEWPLLIQDYLRTPKDPMVCAGIAEYLRDAHWPKPLEAGEAGALKDLLAGIDDTAEAGESGPRRETLAQPADVALEIPADVNPVLVESFLAEGPLQAGAYTSLVEQVIRGGAGVDTLNEARRIVHAIKGEANTVGVRGVAALTHHLEDLLEYLAKNALKPEGRLAKLLMDAADCLEMMFESLLAGEAGPAQALGVLQRLLDAANAIDSGEPIEAVLNEPNVPLPASSEPASAAELQTSQPEPAALASVPSANPQPGHPWPATLASLPSANPETTKAEVSPKIRIAAATIDEMLRLSGEMTIGRAHVQERLHQAFRLTADLREHQNLLQQRAGELDHIVTVQGVAAGQKRDAAERGGGEAVFDALEMDQYHELHGAVHGLVETIADLQMLGNRILDTLAALDTAVTQQGLVNGELHEQIMRSRMVSASVIEPRLARTLRQVCEATGKRAALRFHGGDVMLDDHVVNDLINPLTHLLRNAVDHGIEASDARARAGKPKAGTVALSFEREGSHIVIRCEDDGAGLDLGRIRAVGLERGFIAPGAEPGEAEIARLILVPGFSTSLSVSEVSGRGVGMDIVHTGVRKLKGTIDIRTEAGKGCLFTLRLPMTLGTAHCLLVQAAGQIAAIPTDSLDRAVYGGAQQVQRLGGRCIYREERESHDVYDLAALLDYPIERALGEPGDARSVVIVNDAGGKTALVVDALLSGRDLVIKSLGRHLSRVRSVIGASLLGDGRVLPVLDIHELLRMRREAGSETQPHPVPRPAAGRAREARDILVVDDSLSVRQALAQLLNGEGYQVQTAKDGVEALEYFAKRVPAAVVVDLEMPRMNGLELTSRLRAREETRGIPVIMVTSRSSDKHRQQARLAGVDLYVTKPYREEDLLSQLRSMLHKAA